MTIYSGQPTPTASVMFRPSQILKRYNLPRDLVYQAIKNGKLSAYNVGGAVRPAFLISDADVLAWLETLRVGK